MEMLVYKKGFYNGINCALILYSIIAPFDTFEISFIWNIMENGAFALLEQMLHFP